MSTDKFDPGWEARKWWQSLQPQIEDHNGRTNRGDPGALARLRRAANPVEALMEEQTIRLARMMIVGREDYAKLEHIGVLAGVLAHVKEHDGKSKAAQQLGPQKDDSCAMSSLRFHRLLAAQTPVELMTQMRHAVKLLKGKANITDIARAIYFWNNRTRIEWTYSYWNAGIGSPVHTDQKLNKTQEA